MHHGGGRPDDLSENFSFFTTFLPLANLFQNIFPCFSYDKNYILQSYNHRAMSKKSPETGYKSFQFVDMKIFIGTSDIRGLSED